MSLSNTINFDNNAMKSQASTLTNFLPESFQPTKQEVVIGRGRKIEQHAGNLKLRSLVSGKAQEYVGYADKTMKSRIISSLGNQIKAESQFGGFVKKDPKQGRWFVVSESCIRATIAQAFRDRLSPSYKSSKFSKQRRRWTAKEETHTVVKKVKTETSSISNNDAAASCFGGTFNSFGGTSHSGGDAFPSSRRDSLLGFHSRHQRDMFRPTSSNDSCHAMLMTAAPTCVGSAFTATQGGKSGSTSDILRRCLDVLEEDDDDFFNVSGNPFEPTPMPEDALAQPFLPDDEDLWMI